jgi:hypothetical protein
MELPQRRRRVSSRNGGRRGKESEKSISLIFNPSDLIASASPPKATVAVETRLSQHGREEHVECHELWRCPGSLLAPRDSILNGDENRMDERQKRSNNCHDVTVALLLQERSLQRRRRRIVRPYRPQEAQVRRLRRLRQHQQLFYFIAKTTTPSAYVVACPDSFPASIQLCFGREGRHRRLQLSSLLLLLLL